MSRTMEMTDYLEQARKQLGDVTGLKPLAVTRAFRDGQGWHIGVDMLEMSRVPPSSDVLGCYEVLLAEDGTMLKFERKRTRVRGEPVEDGGQ